MARGHDGPEAGDAGSSGQELADRDVLPQGRDAAEPAADAGAAGERVGPARGREGEAAGIRERLLWIAHQLQRAVRRRRRSVQGQRRRLEAISLARRPRVNPRGATHLMFSGDATAAMELY